VAYKRSFSRDEAAELWERPEVRLALLRRDVASVFQALRRRGVSQRLMAYYTGQSQSEISEILNGRRVGSYDLLERICVGLMIPPGYMGMAYDLQTIRLLGPSHPQWPAEVRPKPASPPPPAESPRLPAASHDTRWGEEGNPPWLDRQTGRIIWSA
jgi:transcriptional regulator with XRE-family HTH domain